MTFYRVYKLTKLYFTVFTYIISPFYHSVIILLNRVVAIVKFNSSLYKIFSFFLGLQKWLRNSRGRKSVFSTVFWSVIFCSIGDFHRMKSVEFHFFTYLSILTFEWRIQKKSNEILRNSWIFRKNELNFVFATTLINKRLCIYFIKLQIFNQNFLIINQKNEVRV